MGIGAKVKASVAALRKRFGLSRRGKKHGHRKHKR